MTEPVLDIVRLSVAFDTALGPVEPLGAVSLAIAPGACLGVLGGRGAGKSLTFQAAFGLGPPGARASGAVRFQGQEMLQLKPAELDAIRGRAVSFWSGAGALAPNLPIGRQLGEVLEQHLHIRGAAARERSKEWLERVRLTEAGRRLGQFPHELAPALRRRVLLAMAMLCEPALLIADEPTGDLDTLEQGAELDLLEDLQRDTGMALALLSREPGVIARLARQVCVFAQGEVVEQGEAEAVFARPQSAVTRALVEAAPRLDRARARLLAPPVGGAPALAVDDLRVSFRVKTGAGLFGGTRRVRAIDGVSFSLERGETLGVIGESGAGKSALARAVAQVLPRDAGAVAFMGRALLPSQQDAIRRARHDLQIAFAGRRDNFDPCATVGASIGEPLLAFEPHLTRADRAARVHALMQRFGLDPSLDAQYPRALSDADLQRAALARATILKPKLLICDEPAAGLDAPARAHMLTALAALQREEGTAILYLSRDLAAAREIAHALLILYRGRAVECGPAETLLRDARHPYTRALIAATLIPDPTAKRARAPVRPAEDPLRAHDTRAALRFLPARIKNDPDAVQYHPRWLQIASGHFVAEHDPAAVA